jgi:RNA polymerase sigma-70 factor (ECF subfamily)
MKASAKRAAAIPARSERRPVVAHLSLFDSDRAIVAGLRAGQSAAGAAVYDRYHLHVRRVLVRVLGPDSELGDLLQDVFVAAIDGIERLEDPDAIRGWLTGIAVYVARGEIRRRARARWFPLFARDELPEVEAPLSSEETGEAVRTTYRILGKLAADERVAFALRFIDGMELVEVADACGVSLATVKRTLARAQKKFGAIAKTYPELHDWLERSARWT